MTNYPGGREFPIEMCIRDSSKTVISTRESLHLFLNDATSEKIEEKIYFFHCTAALVNEPVSYTHLETSVDELEENINN